ncbi:MAG: Eco57I restriction-modification methylase domain-containing protein [Candidatus Hodarchaeota archaeon]
MVNQQPIEEISIKYWLEFREKGIKNVKSWLNFLNFFSHNHIIKGISFSSTTKSELIPIGEEGNSLFFLAKNISDYNSIMTKITICIKTDVHLQEKTSRIVVIPSSEGIEFLVSYLTTINQSIEAIKIIKFPQGRIPGYFLSLKESNPEASLSELLKQFSDISALESDYINQTYNNLKSKDTLILYSVIVLLCSELSDLRVLNDVFRVNFSNMKCHLEEFLLLIKNSLNQNERKYDNITAINKVFNNLCIQTSIIDLKLIIDFLQRYPISLREPSLFYQEVAITPHILSEIVEKLMGAKSKTKKNGKYYTHLKEVGFITHLALYRFLHNKISSLNSKDLFTSIYKNWGFKELIQNNSENISIRLSSLRILDPACGSGSFLISISSLIGSLVATGVISNFKSLELWGNDIDSHAIAATRLRLAFLEINGLDRNLKFPFKIDFYHIVQKDFFASKYPLEFDLIIGNPPWVRHEDIGGDQPSRDKKQLQARIKKILGKNMVFDRKSDLYIYFCILSLSLLNKDGGLLAFLTSNAWLEVKYGKTLQNYLLINQNGIRTFEIIHWARERLWEQLGINSVIFIAEKLQTGDNKTQNSFKSVFTESFVNFSSIPTTSLRNGIIIRKDYEDRYYRTEVIRKDQLRKTHKWAGTFLRTSGRERRLIDKLSKMGVPLTSLADVRFGLKTGANNFFHLQSLKNKSQTKDYTRIKNRPGYEGSIEKEFLIPLIKSPTEIDGFIVHGLFSPSYWLFYCHLSREQLKGSRALEYIEWAESEPVTIKQGLRSGTTVKGFSSIRSVQQRELWYSLGEYSIPNLLWTKSYHVRPGCLLNERRAIPDQRFYSIYSKLDKYIPLLLTFLNSSLVWAQMEVQGNTNMGYGVLDTNVYWLKSIKIPLEAIEEKQKLHELNEKLLKENKRYSMLEFSQIRLDIDEFYGKYFELSSEDIQILSNFILKTLSNRLKIP